MRRASSLGVCVSTGLFEGNRLAIETAKAMLRERFAKIDRESVSSDAREFLEPRVRLAYFEEDFFSSVAETLETA